MCRRAHTASALRMLSVVLGVGFMCRSSRVKANGAAAPTASTTAPGTLARDDAAPDLGSTVDRGDQGPQPTRTAFTRPPKRQAGRAQRRAGWSVGGFAGCSRPETSAPRPRQADRIPAAALARPRTRPHPEGPTSSAVGYRAFVFPVLCQAIPATPRYERAPTSRGGVGWPGPAPASGGGGAGRGHEGRSRKGAVTSQRVPRLRPNDPRRRTPTTPAGHASCSTWTRSRRSRSTRACTGSCTAPPTAPGGPSPSPAPC